ncbi:MAG: hypothetical protein ACFCUI_00150 [Bernardetiaceae bacterium]
MKKYLRQSVQMLIFVGITACATTREDLTQATGYQDPANFEEKLEAADNERQTHLKKK